MRGLDTNILVRYLAADDEKQLAAADRLMAQCRRRQEQLFVPVLVVCETVWVLESRYEQTKTAIVAALEQVLSTSLFVVEEEELIRESLDAYSRGKGDFADYVISGTSARNGCRDTVSFDRALRGEPGFTILG
jgi:predicted nucleic-acid-binding protein